MRTNNALQVIFAFFLGLVVVAFVAIGVNTFYPEPEYGDGTGTASAYADWRITTGIILLVCATVLLVVSLLMPEEQAVLSNGVLLGGVFTMVYAVGVALSSDRSVIRFLVVGVALAVTIGIGYLKFVRGRRRVAGGAPSSTVDPAAAPVSVSAGPPPFESGASVRDGSVEERLAAVERRMDALARALQP